MQTFYPPLRFTSSAQGYSVAETQTAPSGGIPASNNQIARGTPAGRIPVQAEQQISVGAKNLRTTVSRSVLGASQKKHEAPPTFSQKSQSGDLLDSTWQEQLAGCGRNGLQDLLQLIERRQTQFSELNLATALHRIAALGGHHERILGATLLDRIRHALRNKPEAFRAQSLANMCWAVARLQWPCQGFLDNLGEAARLQLVNFKSAELSMVLWGLASSPYASAQARSAMMEDVAHEFLRRGAAAFDAQSIATIAYAAGTLGLSEKSPLWAAVAVGSEDRVDEFSDRQVVNLVWAYATVTNEDGIALFERVDDAWIPHVKDLAPIDLSLVAWAMAKMSHGSTKFFEEVAAAVVAHERRWDESDSRNIATLIYAFAYAGLASEHDMAFQVLARAVERRLPDFQMQGLTNAVWGWATACYCERPWFAAVASEVIRRPACEFEPLDAANCLWAFAAASYNGDWKLVNHLTETSDQFLSEFTPQNTAISLWSLATLEVRDQAFFQKAADHFVGHLSDCKTQELNNILWACATASVRLPWLFLKADNQALAHGLQEFKTHELSIMLWAHGMAGVCNHEFFDAVVDEILENRGIDSCSPREVANSAWAYSTIIGKAHKPWLAAIASYGTPARFAEFDMQCIGNVLWAFATVGVFSESVFRIACDEMAIRCNSATAETIQNISQVVSAVHAARFVHVPFLSAAAACYLGHLGLGSDVIGSRELVLLCNAVLPARAQLSCWKALEDTLRSKLFVPLLATIPRRPVHPSSGAHTVGHADAWAAFDDVVARLELDHLGVFYTARLLLEAGVASEVKVLGLESDEVDVGILASRSEWARRAASSCVEDRARIVREGTSAETHGGKLTRQLDKVNKRDILAWASYDVWVNVPGAGAPERRIEPGRTFSWRQDIEERQDNLRISPWIRPLITKSRQAPNMIGEHDRSGHAERGALLEIASGWLQPPGGIQTCVEGTLQLYVSHFPCISCVCVIAQFARLFPRVSLHISFADSRATNCRDLLTL